MGLKVFTSLCSHEPLRFYLELLKILWAKPKPKFQQLPPVELSAGVWQRRGDGPTEFWLSGAAAGAAVDNTRARCALYPTERFMFRWTRDDDPNGVPLAYLAAFRVVPVLCLGTKFPKQGGAVSFRVLCD